MTLKLRDAIVALFFGAALTFFYLKYVPLIGPFQALFLPVCVGLALLSALDIRRGTLVFLFLLPLVNSWPYFFGVGQATPHAPAASVLFLFFIWGWLIQRLFQSPNGDRDRALPDPWRAPLLASASLVAASAVILIWKWSNFFPLASSGIYELAANVNGVTTGGAAMSTVFHALSYLGGFVFFLILSRDFPWRKDLTKALGALATGLLLAILFGSYQHFFNPALGNTAFWVRMGQINATFKDPNAFGVWLSMAGPLALGGFFYARGALRALLAAVFGLGLFIFPLVGARSGLLGLGLALAWFAFYALPPKKLYAAAALALVLLAAFLGIARLTHAPLLARLTGSHKGPSAKSGLVNVSPERYFLWKEAVAMIRDYPMTGVGIGAFIIELPNYYTEDKTIYEGGFAGWRRSDSAENIFLQVGAEMGLAGLLAFGWVYWTIGSTIKRGLRRGREWGRDRPLFLGVAAGLIAFFINSLFHSYIGSFEAQLGFWFLAAMLAFLADGAEPAANPGSETSPVRRGSGMKRRRAALALSLAAFGGLLLWNSTHSLSLAERTRIFHLNREFGLYQREKTEDGKEFRWTREYGGLPVRVTGTVMELPLRAAHPGIERAPVKVELFFIRGFFKEKLRLGEVSLAQNGWTTIELPTPGIVGQEGILLAEVGRTWNPLKTNGSPDPRNLGVALGVVSFRD